MPLEQLQRAQNGLQRVVQLVRDARYELPDRLHLLGLDELALESVGVGRVLQDRLRQVRPADRLAGVAALREHGVVDLPAELLQLRGHALGAQLAVGARGEQTLGEDRVVVVDAVAEHVQVLVAAEHRRDLGRGDDRHAVLGAGGDRLVDAVDGVVVGQRQQLDSGGRRVRDDLRGRQRPVGVQRVGLKLVGREAHGARGYRARARFRPRGRAVCGSIVR